MDDFASASMVRLLLRAMTADGLAAPMPLPRGARVPLRDKQQVVACIVRAGGLPRLLHLAQQVQHIEGEPLYQALVGARDPHDFLARWQRLERYVHARHRVVALGGDAVSLALEHRAREGLPPAAAESVAVLGVWIGALRAIGVEDVRAEIGGQVAHGDGAAERWAAAPLRPWRLQWSPRDQARTVDARGGDMGLPSGGPWPWPEPAPMLAGWLEQDPGACPGLDEAAAALKLPRRTLQRRLATAGLSFRQLLGEVRVRRAAALLARGRPGLAEIGFLCGYADQAHFTREFIRRAGVPPARFRAAAAGLQ